MTHPLPSDLLGRALGLLARATADPRSALRTPVLATADAAGAPDGRVVVLRAFNADTRTLGFHTDARAVKVSQLRGQPRAVLIFYDPAAQLQLRARGRVALHHGDAVAEAGWARAGAGRALYRRDPAPGTPIAAPDGSAERLDDAAAYAHFVWARLTIDALDYLDLKPPGHHRLRFTWTGSGVQATWLAP